LTILPSRGLGGGASSNDSKKALYSLLNIFTYSRIHFRIVFAELVFIISVLSRIVPSIKMLKVKLFKSNYEFRCTYILYSFKKAKKVILVLVKVVVGAANKVYI
jgi:hypothetical protein